MNPTSTITQSSYSHPAPTSKNTATTGHTNKSHLDNVCFDVDSKGKPLSNRKLRGLSHLEWVVFNLKRCATTFVRTFKWIKIVLSIIRDSNKDADKVNQVKKIRAMGGIMAKLLQAIASNDELISHFFKIKKEDDLFKEIKEELRKSMHDNDGMSVSKITKIIDGNGLEYDKSRTSEIKILGRGTIASVVSVPMLNGGTKVVKVVNKNLEITFLSDKTIISMFLKLISFAKPKTLGKGTVQATVGFLDTMSKEFDLRYEAQNTITQKNVFEEMKQGKNSFNITEENSCPCKASTHGKSSTQCERYLENKPKLHAKEIVFSNPCCSNENIKIPVEIKVPNVDRKVSTRNMMVMDEIHGLPLSSTKDEFKTHIIMPLRNLEKLPLFLLSDDASDSNWNMAFEILKDSIQEFSSIEWLRGLYNTGHCSADMHNGNIMVAIENDKLTIYHIDFGNYISINKDTVITLFVLIDALEKATKNNGPTTKSEHIDIIIDNMRHISAPSKEGLNINWDAFKSDLLKAIDTAADEHQDINLFLLKIFDIGFKYDLLVYPAIAGLFRSKILLDAELDAKLDAK